MALKGLIKNDFNSRENWTGPYLDNCNHHQGVSKDSGEAGQVQSHSQTNVGHPRQVLLVLHSRNGGCVELLREVEILRDIEPVLCCIMVVGGIRGECYN